MTMELIDVGRVAAGRKDYLVHHLRTAPAPADRAPLVGAPVEKPAAPADHLPLVATPIGKPAAPDRPVSYRILPSTFRQEEIEPGLDRLGPVTAARVAAFLDGLDCRCTLARAEKEALRDDFRAALLHYQAVGLTLDEALERLDLSQLGGFYARPARLWYRLDDAAKIYPLSMRHGQMRVFRLSVRFKEEVVPELLQMALTFTIRRFPTFATTVKKGFFWHYLDAAKRRYLVQPESDLPCQPLAVAGSRSQSFRVLYFRNRVSVEYFHILTDGHGGLVFLKALAAQYLKLMGVTPADPGDLLDIDAAPTAAEAANAFALVEPGAGDEARPGKEAARAAGAGTPGGQAGEGSGRRPVKRSGKEAARADGVGASGLVSRPALQMSGRIAAVSPCRVLNFRIELATLLAAAAGRRVTVTAYLLSVLLVAARHATDETEGDLSVQVPVDLRRYHPSDTLRNFSTYCGIRLPSSDVTTVDAIAGEVSAQLARKTSPAGLAATLAVARRIVAWTRWVPLAVKAPVARSVYGLLDDALFTTTLSNLGVVSLPPELAERIDSFDCVLDASRTNRASCALVTFGGWAVLSVTKATADPSFEERLYELLRQDRVGVTVEGSESYGD